MTSPSTPSLEEWLIQGHELGYCSEPVCGTHDGTPSTEEEEAEFEAGYDPCQVVVRIW